MARAKAENVVDAEDVVDAVDAVDAEKAVKAEIATEMGNRVSAPIAKIDSHTTDACRKRKCAQEEGNSRGNHERICHQYRLPGYVKVDYVAYKRVREWWRVKKATARTLTTAAAPNFSMFKKLSFPIVIELGDDNSVTATHYGFVDVIQDYLVEALLLFDFPSYQSTNWIWWAYDYISEQKMLLYNPVFRGTTIASTSPLASSVLSAPSTAIMHSLHPGQAQAMVH
jgi:hypothetical protein